MDSLTVGFRPYTGFAFGYTRGIMLSPATRAKN